MAQQNPIPVAEGDKLEIDSEDDVYVVTWVGISIKAEPAGGDLSLADRVKFDTDELRTKIDRGEVTVLSDNYVTTQPAREFRDHLDVEHFAERLEGRSGGLRTSKPQTEVDTGLIKAVWRYSRFCSGADTSMPVTCHWWLQSYLDENDIDASVSGILDDAGKEIHQMLFDIVDAVLAELGLATGQGARRWEKAGAF